MRKTLLSSLLFLSACAPIHEPKLLTAVRSTTPGYDVLALPKYCDTFLAAPKFPAVSTLLGPFGDPLPCLDKRLAQGDVEKVQIDLRDATCYRHNLCPSGTPSLTDWKDLLARAKRVGALAIKYPATQFWISPWLEHDIKEVAVVRKGCAVALQGCPTCKCINSPVSGARPAEIPLELHGTQASAFSISGDGSSSFDGDNIENDGNNFQHRLAGTNQTYAWWNELNLRCTGEKTTPIPAARTARPTAWQFQLAHKIFVGSEDPYPGTPKACKKVRDVAKGEIVKPTAEAYCNSQKPDVRGNHPMLILAGRVVPGTKASVYDSGNRRVGCFRAYGPYSGLPAYTRWYMGDCSGQTAWDLYLSLASEWGFVDLDGKGNCLRFNSLRRQGVYR